MGPMASTSGSPALTVPSVVALATDPAVMDRTGQVLAVANLAHEYAFTEDDAAQLPIEPT